MHSKPWSLLEQWRQSEMTISGEKWRNTDWSHWSALPVATGWRGEGRSDVMSSRRVLFPCTAMQWFHLSQWKTHATLLANKHPQTRCHTHILTHYVLWAPIQVPSTVAAHTEKQWWKSTDFSFVCMETDRQAKKETEKRFFFFLFLRVRWINSGRSSPNRSRFACRRTVCTDLLTVCSRSKADAVSPMQRPFSFRTLSPWVWPPTW